MDSSRSFDIFEIYRQYCVVTEDDSEISTSARDGLNNLLKMIEYRMRIRISIFDELMVLMSRIDLGADFPHFYGFVFFFCRENQQKNITVSRAVYAWRLVLTGRFRLLNQFCDFVERNQKHNISEDTWRQVLGFSRCVDENLGGYDPQGAWPSLIDDFVEHMYRIGCDGGKGGDVGCTCEDGERVLEEPLPQMKIFGGCKRKRLEWDAWAFPCQKLAVCRRGDDTDGVVLRSMSPCGVEGSLTRGFAGLLSASTTTAASASYT